MHSRLSPRRPPGRRPRCRGCRRARPSCRPSPAGGGCGPATASFVSGGSAWWPSSSRLASRCARRSSPASREVLGHLVAEDLERTLDARARGDGCLGGAAQVRVVEVHEAVDARRAPRAAGASGPSRSRLVRRPSARGRRGSPPLRGRRRGARRALRGPWPGCPGDAPHPTSAIAASGAGQVISSAADRPGSLSVPAARNAPRQIAARSERDPVVSLLGRPRTGRRRWSSRPVWRASVSPPSMTRTA